MRRSMSVVLGLCLAVLAACRADRRAPVVSAGSAVVIGGADALALPASPSGVAAAFDGASWLVVWSDARSGSADVWGARLSAAGEPLDARPIAIAAAPGEQIEPAVAFDGASYLVVWEDHRSGSERSIAGARVTPAGAVVDPAPITIAAATYSQRSPSVAFDGATFVVVWEVREEDQADVLGARVGTDGKVIGAGPFAVNAAPSRQSQASIACRPGSCLAAWRDGRNGGPDVYGARIAGGGVLDPAGLALSRASSSQGTPLVTAGPAGWLVVWNDTRNGTADVYATRVAESGDVADAQGLAVSTAAGAQQGAAAAFEGETWVVAWQDTRSGAFQVQGARVDPAAGALDADGFAVLPQTTGARVALASDGNGRTLVAAATSVSQADPLLPPVVKLETRIVTTRAALSVAKAGHGAGTVTSAPARIDCGAACTAMFDAPTDVTLTASASPGSEFTGWLAGCPGTGLGPCTVTVDGTRSVTAQFTPYLALDVARDGAGTGTVTSTPGGLSCGTACATQLLEGTAVSLSASPATGSLFGGWAGPCQPYDPGFDPAAPPPCAFQLDRPAAVTATFVQAFKATATVTGSGRGTVSGPWLSCTTGSTAGCVRWYPAGSAVSLQAAPAAANVFKGWSGACDGLGDCALDMTANRGATAKFEPSTFPLRIAFTGGGVATVTGDAIACTAGATTGCTPAIANTTPYGTVSLTIAPDASSLFKGWSGCNEAAGTTCSVVMSGARSVTATVQPSLYPLTASLNLVSGATGSVSGEGLACQPGSTAGCTTKVANGATATVTATPDASSILKSWSGCTEQAGNVCSVAMLGARTVSARFEPAFYTLTGAFTLVSGGSGAITGEGMACAPGATSGCAAKIANGATATLTAQPDSSSVLKSWSGCAEVNGDGCSVTMTSAKTVTARFEPAFFTLTGAFTLVSGASGTLTGEGLACAPGSTTGCAVKVANGATATITSHPDASSITKSWSGCAEAAGDVCTVSMTSAKTVTARLEPAFYALTAKVAGAGAGGTIRGPSLVCASTTGCIVPVANGQDVTLTATPDASSILKSWSGCTPSADGASCTAIMTSAKVVTATFAPSTYPLTVAPSGTDAGGRVTGPGLDCAAAGAAGCTAPEPNGATVTLQAIPDASSVLKSWIGCTPADAGTCSVTMTSAKSVTAVFQPSTYVVSVAQAVSGGATGRVTGPGIDCVTGATTGCSAPQPTSGAITLLATPGDASVFKSWSGCTSADGASCTVTVTAAKTVTATFQPSTYALTVNPSGAGGAAGRITGPGLDCTTGSTAGCTAPQPNGAAVTLSAAPGDASVFKSWSGCTTTDGPTCTVTVTGARTVTATFQPSTYLLTVAQAVSGGATGGVTGPGIECGTGATTGCSAPQPNGASVVLTASAGPGSVFKSWSGCTAVDGASCAVTVTGARTVTATFQPAFYRVTVSPTWAAGTGGRVTGPGIDCAPGGAGTCSADEPNGSTITLTAVPDAGTMVKSWSGCTSWSGNTCSVLVSGARTVIAAFQPATYPLTVTTAGTGTGSVSGPGIACSSGSTAGCTASEPNGSQATLTASPSACSTFSGWSGGCSGTAACTVSMTAARTVTATFAGACATAP
jgi:hypothetical protein